MSDKKLYQLPALSLGATDAVYVSRADGSADGKADFTAVSAIVRGLNAGYYDAAGSATTAVNALAASLAPVATSGDYSDLSGLPSLFSGDYNDLTNLPTLFSGDYNDLANLPALFDGVFSSLSGKPTTLSGYGITDAQPLDGDLTAIAALSGTNTIYYRSAANTWSAVTIGSNLTFSAGTLSATGGGGGSGSITASGYTMNTARMLGRTTASSGAVEEITVGTGLTFTSTALGLDLATAAQYQANTASKVLSTDKVWSAADNVALTDAATVAVDMATGFSFTVTLGGNRTLGNPSNTKNGQTGAIWITQDATGSRTLAYGSNWKFAGGLSPTLTTTAGAVDALFYQVKSSTFVYATLIKNVADVTGSTSGGYVSAFNTRTGDVTLTSGDVTTALTFTPLNAAASSFSGSAAKLTTARNIAMTGDVTWNLNFDGSAGVTAAGTIANDAVTTVKILNSNVTLAKIANIADQTILGNNTGGAAAPVALTAAQTRTVLGQVKDNYAASAAPAASDDSASGYAVGSRWLWAATGAQYVCRDATASAAKWVGLANADFPGFTSGNWYGAVPAGTQMAVGAALTNGTIRLQPFPLKQRVTLSTLGAFITTLATSGNIQLAIYAHGSGKATGAALASTASIGTGSTGFVSAAIAGGNVTLEPGLYWMAVNADNATVVLQTVSNSLSYYSSLIGSATATDIVTGGATLGVHDAVTQTYGTWPDLTSATITKTASIRSGALYLKVA